MQVAAAKKLKLDMNAHEFLILIKQIFKYLFNALINKNKQKLPRWKSSLKNWLLSFSIDPPFYLKFE